MATLVLGAVGSAFGGPVGGFIGATIGGYIDNAYIMPWLFPQDPAISGQRLDGVQFAGANEGEPIQWIYGPTTRTSGVVVWMDKREEVKTTHSAGKGGPDPLVTYTYYISLAVLIGEANSPQIIQRLRKVFADVTVIYSDGERAKYDSLTFYDGSQTTPDPLIESKLGAGNVQIFKNKSYLVIERLFITAYGNRVPTFSIKAEQHHDTSLQDVIGALALRHGYTANDIDVSRLPFCFKGVSVSGPKQGKDVLDALTTTYAVTVQEADGKIIFFPRGKEAVVEVAEEDIGTNRAPGINLKDGDQMKIPGSASVRYVNSDLDCQPGEIPYKNPDAPENAEARINFQTPVTLNGEEAKALAKRLLWAGISERETVDLTLPPSYSNLVAGDAITFTFRGRSFYVYCKEVFIGADYLVKISGHIMFPSIYDQTGIGQLGFGADTGYTPPVLEQIFLDMPGFTQEAVEKSGIHWATHTVPTDASFISASLYTSVNDSSYTLRGTNNRKLPFGFVSQGLDRFRAYSEIDMASSLEVTMNSGVLSSATEEEVFQGLRNIAAIETEIDPYGGTPNWEIIGFLDVEDLGDNKYRLSRILRGLRGTEYLIPQSSLYGAKFVLLEVNTGAIKFWDSGPGFIGTGVYHKIVPEGALVSSVEPTLFVHRGRSNKCFSPSHVRVKRVHTLLTKNAEFSWQRRSKMPNFTSGFVDVAPFTDDETDWFRIEMRLNIHPDTDPVLHTEVVQGSSWTLFHEHRISISERMGSVWNSNDAFWFWVRQISGVSGEGERSVPMFIDKDFLP